MPTLHVSRFKPRHLEDDLARMELVIQQARRARAVRIAFVWLTFAALLTIVAVAPEGAGALIVIGFFVLIFGLAGGAALVRKQAKLDFTRELLVTLRDELHPDAKIRITFDPRHYDLDSKRIWSGRSIAGNPKHKYTDKWLDLAIVLADHTRVHIVCQAGIKTKKRALVKEKRRLFLTVVPAPRYDPDAIAADLDALRKQLKDAVGFLFHNRPEAFHARPRMLDGSIAVKVMQEDAPVLAREVVALLRALIGFLGERQRAAA